MVWLFTLKQSLSSSYNEMYLVKEKHNLHKSYWLSEVCRFLYKSVKLTFV